MIKLQVPLPFEGLSERRGIPDLPKMCADEIILGTES